MGDVLTVMPFLSLARELAALMLPLQPRQDFRDDLERSLVSAARQQHARGALGAFEPVPFGLDDREALERRWMIAGAAAVGSAMSIAGIVAYVLRRRERVA